MSAYKVQFTLPVDNPEDNVRKIVKKGHYLFEIPINHPRAHNLGLQELYEAHERAMNSATIHTP